MSLEQQLAALTAAVEANTAAVLGAGTNVGEAPAAEEKAPAKKPAAKKAAAKATSQYSADQVRDTLIKVKSEVGEDEAKRIISEVGGYEKLAQLIADPSKFDAVMEACEAALSGEDEGGDDSGL
jgi:vacuolar-type H+-ATPase subunit H